MRARKTAAALRSGIINRVLKGKERKKKVTKEENRFGIVSVETVKDSTGHVLLDVSFGMFSKAKGLLVSIQNFLLWE